MKIRFDLPNGCLSGLLDNMRLYFDRGLSERLDDALKDFLEKRIREAVGSSFIKCVIETHSTAPASAHTILDDNGIAIRQIRLMLDLAKDFELEDIVFGAGARLGYYDFGEWKADPGLFDYKQMATRNRYRKRISGIWLYSALFGFSRGQVESCQCPDDWLYTAPQSGFHYLRWFCACCGRTYTCECLRGVAEILAERNARGTHSYSDVTIPTYRENTCHLCCERPSTITYQSPMYGGSKVKQKYYPYLKAEQIRYDLDIKEAENRIRDRLGVPRIGEGWLGETELFHMVRILYSEHRIEREASPPWLGRQRLDIFFPDLGVAIEYHGEQHFGPVSIFGGEHGFRKAQERDREKRRKAEEAGVTLIEISHSEAITLEELQKRIDMAISERGSCPRVCR